MLSQFVVTNGMIYNRRYTHISQRDHSTQVKLVTVYLRSDPKLGNILTYRICFCDAEVIK
jgi:hypothetical protein